jgi:hypothetical protein
MKAVRITVCFLASLAMVAPTTRAADLDGSASNCRYIESARTLLGTGDIRRLRAGLYGRYNHAINVFHSAVYSGSPAFLWANETKIACAKAIGYLKLGHFRREIDVEMIQKCECFHTRMVWYLRHPVAISSG